MVRDDMQLAITYKKLLDSMKNVSGDTDILLKIFNNIKKIGQYLQERGLVPEMINEYEFMREYERRMMAPPPPPPEEMTMYNEIPTDIQDLINSLEKIPISEIRSKIENISLDFLYYIDLLGMLTYDEILEGESNESI